MLPIKNMKPLLSEIGLPFWQTFFYNFLALFILWIYVAIQTTIRTNSHIRHIKLPDRYKVLMVRDSINNNKMTPTLSIRNMAPLLRRLCY
jgi:hypothetical protein